MFQPIDNGRPHSIVEAVFALRLSAPLEPKHVLALAAFGKEAWKEDLPGIDEAKQLSLPLLPGAQIPTFIGGSMVAFQSFRPNGSLAWRLLAVQDQILVNCLDYESWETVWPRARKYLVSAAGAAFGDAVRFSGIALQYINSFKWSGERPARKEMLLRRDNPRISEDFWRRQSEEWHLHQGWFDRMTEPVSGRVLSREHLTAQIDAQGTATTSVDLFKRYDFGAAYAQLDRFAVAGGPMDAAFAAARVLARRALRDYLRDDMLDQIGAIELGQS